MSPTTGHSLLAAVVPTILLVALALVSPCAVEAQDLKAGVVKLLVERSDGGNEVGAGLVVGSDEAQALVLTAYHVIDGAQKIDVIFHDKLYLEYQGRPFRYSNEILDIGVVVVDIEKNRSVLETLPKVAVGESATLGLDSPVRALGHPLNADWEWASGKVVRVSSPDDPRKLHFTRTGIDRGNSGGPLFDANRALVGMVLRKTPRVAIAVKIESVLETLENWRLPRDYLRMPGESEEREPVATAAVDPSADSDEETSEELEPQYVLDPDGDATDNPWNSVPVAVDDGKVTPEDTLVNIDVLANDRDEDGDELTLAEVDRESVEGGTVAANGRLITYIPPRNFSGADSFRYSVTDNKNGVAWASVTIAVAATNDPPTLQASDLTVREGEPIRHEVVAEDPDGDPLHYSATGLPPGAEIDPQTGVLTFAPSYAVSTEDSAASYEVEFSVVDPDGETAAGSATITVENVAGGVDPGSDVEVEVREPRTGTQVAVAFQNVSGAGVTTVSASTLAPAHVPPHSRVTGNVYYEVITGAAHSGPVQVCMSYAGFQVDQDRLSFRHLASSAPPTDEGQACVGSDNCWLEIAQNRDPVGKVLCGSVPALPVTVALFESLELVPDRSVIARDSPFRARVPVADPESVEGADWSWGDGSTSATERAPAGVVGQYAYGSAGLYQVLVSLRSAEQQPIGSTAFGPLVVYDPSAGGVRGGFTLGSARAGRAGSGEMNTAKVQLKSEYAPGASAPTGEVSVRLEPAGLRFKSESQEWLVLSEDYLALQAMGSLNRGGSYRLLLVAAGFDSAGGAAGFQARVKIWKSDTRELIYDSQVGTSERAAPSTRVVEGRLRRF